jgi:hypothetical protein
MADVAYGYRAVMIKQTAAGYPDGAVKIMNFLKSNYSHEIQAASDRWKVPAPILYAFNGVESGTGGNKLDSFDKRTVQGKSVPNTYALCQTNAIGVNGAIKICLAGDCTLGQIYMIYKAFPQAFEVIKDLPPDDKFWNDEFKSRRQEVASNFFKLSKAAKDFEKAGGNIFSYWDAAAKKLKEDVNFAVNIGAIHIAKYILEDLSSVKAEDVNGKMVKMARLDWVITKYNAGTGAFKKIKTSSPDKVNADTSVFVQVVPAYTKTYIIKMVGENGLLDVVKKGLVKL